MRVSDDITAPLNAERDRVARLEERVNRLEAHLGLSADSSVVKSAAVPPPALSPVFTESTATKKELEFELGQHWFALAGIAILTAGLAFLLSLPYPLFPAAVPSIGGGILALALLTVAHLVPRSVPGGADALRAAGMVLLGFAGLRLFFFGAHAGLDVQSSLGKAVVVAITAFNVSIAWRRGSSWLAAVALTITAALALALGTTSLVLLSVAVIASVTAALSGREKSPVLLLTGILLTDATYFAWAMGDPFRTSSVHFVNEPVWAPVAFLALLPLLASGPLLRSHGRDDPPTILSAFANCAFGYGAFLVHTAAVFPSQFAAFHVTAAVVLLGLAMLFFVRTESRISTFFYAMTGYAALTLAILKVTRAPDVFVWLSVQSVVVVATAIWFRSRLIVVANFFIFAAIVATYVVMTKHESGISVGFGVVALATARILNWQQHRLELKTEFMRNAYLGTAYVIMPYAGYHLVAAKYVALVWIALAAAYYLLNVVVQNQKYRWMAHGTLVLTTLYVMGTGVSRFEPVYRVLSFLVLGGTLIAVSVAFARVRRRQAAIERVTPTESRIR
jgi:hypothetical protein